MNDGSTTTALTKQQTVIAEKLADDIAAARLEPGQKVSMTLLARWLRTTPANIETILPAFLESKLLLKDGKDFNIAPLDRSCLVPGLDERLPLEQLIAQSAAIHATADQIGSMREYTSHMKRCALVGDIDGYMLADRQLERAIGKASQLPEKFEELANIKRDFRRAWLAYNRLRDLSEPAGLRHSLVESIAANDPENAEKAVAAFIDYLRHSF
jgi:DNA-binding GntR family transcriptional regulator